MAPDPLLLLVRDALGLMHPGFADPARPGSVVREFYHQLRKLWDRGVPVGLGLGHLAVRDVIGADLAVIRLGEGGAADEPLAAIAFVPTPAAVAGYPRTIAVAVGTAAELADLPPARSGVARVGFDVGRWRVV